MDTQNGIVSKLWEAVRSDFAHTFPPDIYRSWFEPLYVVSETDDSIVFGVVNDFTAIWLQENYIDVLSRMQIEKLLKASCGTLLFVEHDRHLCEQVATTQILL